MYFKVKVPKDLVALMSAVKQETYPCDDGEHVQNTFEQKVPIPCYLIAIVVGALESRFAIQSHKQHRT